MADRSKMKRSRDFTKRPPDFDDDPSVRAVDSASDAEPRKNAAAVALGRLGGAKGGLARATALSAKERSRIAKKAAQARWKRRR